MAKRQVKVGVRQGGGPPPGYAWNVWVLSVAFRETQDVFSAAQQLHLRLQVQELAREEDPTHPVTQSVDQIESIYELRDKGGPLGKLNARVFFGIDKENRAIVVLGTISKQNNGPTPQGKKITMLRRWRKYSAGDYGSVTV